ncbi:MAG: hypothetical protein KAU20_04745 [Nanoarchaeota archaeon]|nr:hypothetical protein [Nanoarchaeota archaeon]
MKKIKIIINNKKWESELNETNTANDIYDELPLEALIKRWGDEIYFGIPLHMELDETATQIVNKGDIAFWPEDDCFCIFFGATPISSENEIKAASKVNIIGKITKGSLEDFKKVEDNEKVRLEKGN